MAVRDEGACWRTDKLLVTALDIQSKVFTIKTLKNAVGCTGVDLSVQGDRSRSDTQCDWDRDPGLAGVVVMQ